MAAYINNFCNNSFESKRITQGNLFSSWQKYKANKKQIWKGLSKVYTTNNKCDESGDSYIAKLLSYCILTTLFLTENNKARKEGQNEETLENNK